MKEQENAKANTSSIETIGSIKLENKGGFIVKLECYYKKSRFGRPDRKGNTGDILLGKEKTLELSVLGFNDGDLVTAYANVVWGIDNQIDTWFEYKSKDHHTAKFTISGTTLDNELIFKGIE